jgi:hypothetical protein
LLYDLSKRALWDAVKLRVVPMLTRYATNWFLDRSFGLPALKAQVDNEIGTQQATLGWDDKYAKMQRDLLYKRRLEEEMDKWDITSKMLFLGAELVGDMTAFALITWGASKLDPLVISTPYPFNVKGAYGNPEARLKQIETQAKAISVLSGNYVNGTTTMTPIASNGTTTATPSFLQFVQTTNAGNADFTTLENAFVGDKRDIRQAQAMAIKDAFGLFVQFIRVFDPRMSAQ